MKRDNIINPGKKPVRIDRKTVILVDKSADEAEVRESFKLKIEANERKQFKIKNR